MGVLLSLYVKKLGLQPPRIRKVSHQTIRVPLADGVETLAEHWTPDGVTNAPLVLMRTPYGRMLSNLLFARYLTHQGFQVLVQSSRGTDGSEGTFDDPFTCEVEDGVASVAWIRQQPWYPGRFFTFGESYIGYTQLALAEGAGDDLAGCVLRVTPSCLYDMFWPSGMLAFASAFPWSLMASKDPRLGFRSTIKGKANEPKVRAAGKTAPLCETYRTVSGAPIAFWEDWISHPDVDDPYWKRGDLRAALETMTCPVLVQGGWYDLFIEDSLEQYQLLADRGVPVELVLGPWSHAGMLTQALGLTLRDATAWLLEQAGIESRPAGTQPVRLTSIGGAATTHATLPQPTGELVFQLADGGRLGEEVSLEDGTTSFRYDPADPTPAVGGATNEQKAGAADNTALEKRSDVVTFTTEPLTADLHLLGQPVVELAFGSDRPDTCVFVRLCHVAPDGVSTNLTDRILRLSASNRDADGSWQVSLALPMTCADLPAGHRVRLQISSGAYPRFVRHPGTAENPVTAKTFHPMNQVVHHGPSHPGVLRLPHA
jgi:putative CocE/NonD family hydrolase